MNNRNGKKTLSKKVKSSWNKKERLIRLSSFFTFLGSPFRPYRPCHLEAFYRSFCIGPCASSFLSFAHISWALCWRLAWSCQNLEPLFVYGSIWISLDAFFLKPGCAAFKVWTGSIHWTEAGLLMDGRRDGILSCLILVWLTGAITGLQDYTLFFEPWISKIAYIYHIFY